MHIDSRLHQDNVPLIGIRCVVRMCAALVAFSGLTTVAADAPVKIYLNGQELHTRIIQTNGTIYVPLEDIARTLGATVTVTTNTPAPLEGRAPSRPPQPAPPVAEPTTVLLTTPARTSGPGSVKGVLKFKRNVMDNRSVDVGAEAWLVPAADLTALAQATGGSPLEPIPEKAIGWHKRLTADYQFRHAAADKNGVVLLTDVAPGDYTVVLFSHSAGSFAPRDKHGKMRFQKIHVTEGQTADISHNFGTSVWWEDDKPAKGK